MLLAIETSCDETSAAVIRNDTVLSNIVASQGGVHAIYGGVVPELAVREHLRNLMPVIRAALSSAGVGVAEVGAVAATRGPGLPSALMAGYTVGRAMAQVLGVPLFGVHHHEAHLYSPWVGGEPVRAEWKAMEPHVGLVVSGGHTLLAHVSGDGSHRVLGSTLDDAAGECFDKVAKMLGLPYPGGPVLDRLAEEGNPAAHAFPRSLLDSGDDAFSFSGLKTSVRYFLARHPGLAADAAGLRDLCASVRAAIVEVLVGKLTRAALRVGVGCVSVSGGVACNRALRRELAGECRRRGLRLRLVPPSLSTDNAAMIGLLAGHRWARGGEPTPLDLEPLPSWPLRDLECGALAATMGAGR